MTSKERASIVICGAGIAGIATAYWLAVHHRQSGVLIVDPLPPMSLTSAASGENFRNWWPQQQLADMANRSITLMHELADHNDRPFRLTQSGYAYATREADAHGYVSELERTYGHGAAGEVRVHERGNELPKADNGADVLLDLSAIRERFPHLSEDVRVVTLVRRAGDIDSQQLGQYMLGAAKSRGARLAQLKIEGISKLTDRFVIEATGSGESTLVEADIFINAAGPFAGSIADMLGTDLPLQCVYQQKIAFEDVNGVVPRDAPFTIDEDPGPLDWADDVRELLLEDPETSMLAAPQPGGVHVRPEGGAASRWVKLGWATNKSPEAPILHPSGPDTFPEIVMRGAARLVPGLSTYCDDLPRGLSHYGGYYTRTLENWPLIGPMGPPGAFMIAALSGYGTMMACAAGELCAAWVTGGEISAMAKQFSLQRYTNETLMGSLVAQASDGEL